MVKYVQLIDYVVDLEDVVKTLGEMIASLENNSTLKPEKEMLETAHRHVRSVLLSFKRLKGIA